MVQNNPCFKLFHPNPLTSSKGVYDLKIEQIFGEDQDIFVKHIGDTVVTFYIQTGGETVLLSQDWKFSIPKNDWSNFLSENEAWVSCTNVEEGNEYYICNGLIFCNKTIFGISFCEKNDTVDIVIRYPFVYSRQLRTILPSVYTYPDNKSKIAGTWFHSLCFKLFHKIDQTPGLNVTQPNMFTSLKELGEIGNRIDNKIEIQNSDTLISFTFQDKPYPQVTSQKWTYNLCNKRYSEVLWSRYLSDDPNKTFEEPILYQNWKMNLNFLFTSERVNEDEVSVTFEYLFPDRKYLESLVPYL
jgi:hypothetical protein